MGCSGSGKSTYAQHFFPKATVVSADDYFEEMARRQKRTYREVFDVYELRNAHAQCHERFMKAILNNKAVIIVDNTNVSSKDRHFYIKNAKKFNCEIEMHVFSPWVHGRPQPSFRQIRRYLDICHKRSTHGAPREILESQFDKLEYPCGCFQIKDTTIYNGPIHSISSTTLGGNTNPPKPIKEKQVATHTVSFEIPQKLVLAKDIEFNVKSNGKKLGVLLISKGNIEWVPANNSVKKRRMSWEHFAVMMERIGTIAKIK